MVVFTVTFVSLSFADEYIGLLVDCSMTSTHFTAEIVTRHRGKKSIRSIYLGPVTLEEAEKKVAEELDKVKDGHAYIYREFRDRSSNPLVTLTEESQA